ncbi:MAG: TlpA disulfide reductase family protein [Candidatus Promineifilaceae bacterium]
MLKSRFEWVILILGIALIGGGWIAYSQEPTEVTFNADGLSEAPVAGYLAPSFTLTTLQGEEHSLADYQGRPIVLNFWATWCPPCRAEVPHFQDASRIYNGQVAIVGIDQGEPLSLVNDFAAQFGISYPLLLDPDNDVNRQYNVQALPTTVFIDSNGVIREVFTGIINSAVLQDRIEFLLQESS